MLLNKFSTLMLFIQKIYFTHFTNESQHNSEGELLPSLTDFLCLYVASPDSSSKIIIEQAAESVARSQIFVQHHFSSKKIYIYLL